MKTTRMKSIAAAVCVAGLTLGLTACGGDDDTSDTKTSSTASPSSSASASDGVRVDITVAKDGKVTPQGKRVQVKVGQQVTLHIVASADEEVHVHSDPEHSYEVSAGDDVTKSFTIDTPGQVAVEAHHSDTTILQLVVRP